MHISECTMCKDDAVRVFTVGHSTRSFGEFLALLREFRIQMIIDIRRYPSSRKFPHFNSEPLRTSLEREGIEYIWLEDLGGRRHERGDLATPNVGLRSSGFRGYADHMLTEEFRTSVQKIVSFASKRRVAVMCAERLYFKCLHLKISCLFSC